MYEFFDCHGTRLLVIGEIFNQRVFVDDPLKNEALNALFQVAVSRPLKRDVLSRVDWVEVFGTVVDIQDLLNHVEYDGDENVVTVYPAFK